MTFDDAMEQLRQAAALAAARGSLIFHLDLATELAREALGAARVGFDVLAPLVDGEGYRVEALVIGGAMRMVATVRFDAQGRPMLDRRAAPPSRIAERCARARLALGRGAGSTVVIVPTTAGDMVEAYRLATAEAPGPMLLDGHRRLTLGPGMEVGPSVALTVGVPDGAAYVYPDAVPSEVHTYLGLKHGAAIEVATEASGLRWRVDGEKTMLLGRR